MVLPPLEALMCSNGYLYLWLSSAFVYWTSQSAIDRWQRSRKPQPPLNDLGFDLIPRVDRLVYLTDGVGLVGAAFLAKWLCSGDTKAALVTKECLVYSAIGNYFSASLHSVTLIPGSDHSSGFPLFGGQSDKLMSNHTFHMGLFLRILAGYGCIPVWFVAPVILAYSAMMLATRGHYSVDIVLAWWALGLVFMLRGVSPQFVCLEEAGWYMVQ